MEYIALVQGLLEGGEGYINALFGTSTDVHPFCYLVDDSDHLIVEPIDTDVLSAGICVMEQVLVHVGSDHADFPLLAQVVLVEESSVIDLHTDDLEVVGMQSLYGIATRQVAMRDILFRAAAPKNG